MNDSMITVGAFVLMLVVVGLVAFFTVRYMQRAEKPKIEGTAVTRAGLPAEKKADMQNLVARLMRFAALHDMVAVVPGTVTAGGKTAALTLLLVGRFGVLGVKMLGMEGQVYGSAKDETWAQMNGGERREFANPILGAAADQRVIRAALDQAKIRSVPVETAVVFCSKKVELAVGRQSGLYSAASLMAYLKTLHFEEDKKVDPEATAQALKEMVQLPTAE